MQQPSIHLDISTWRVLLKIRFYRESQEMSQKTVAEKLNIGLRSYQRIESGESSIDLAFLYRFCNLFKIDLASLVSTSAPKIDNKPYLFFNNENELLKSQYGANQEVLKTLKLLEQISNKKILFETLHRHQIFQNNELHLRIITPFKQTYNRTTMPLIETIYDKIRSTLESQNIHEELNYWDSICYYRPKFSIRHFSYKDDSNKEVKFCEFTTHVYSSHNITNLSVFINSF